MKAKVLVVEDSPSQRSHITEILKTRGFDVRAASGGIEALKQAKTDPPDVVVLDVVMADMDGYSVCRWLRLTEATRDLAIIMLTVKGEVSNKVEGLNVGADDYLPKPFDGQELEARIFAALRTKGTQKELRRRNTELEDLLQRVEVMAMTDALTGLFNRRRFVDVLKREWATSKRYKNPISVLMVDIDHFKRVNDTHGHSTGDQVLKEVANVISASLRQVDVAARYGGEEFAILLPHTRLDDAAIVAGRIHEKVRSREVALEDISLGVTVSVGAASNEDDGAQTEDELMARADAALYRAKQSGRDQVVMSTGGAKA